MPAYPTLRDLLMDPGFLVRDAASWLALLAALRRADRPELLDALDREPDRFAEDAPISSGLPAALDEALRGDRVHPGWLERAGAVARAERARRWPEVRARWPEACAIPAWEAVSARVRGLLAADPDAWRWGAEAERRLAAGAPELPWAAVPDPPPEADAAAVADAWVAGELRRAAEPALLARLEADAAFRDALRARLRERFARVTLADAPNLDRWRARLPGGGSVRAILAGGRFLAMAPGTGGWVELGPEGGVLRWGDARTGPMSTRFERVHVDPLRRLERLAGRLEGGEGGEAARLELARELADGLVLRAVQAAHERLQAGEVAEEREDGRDPDEVAVALAIRIVRLLDATGSAGEPEEVTRLRALAEARYGEMAEVVAVLPLAGYEAVAGEAPPADRWWGRRWHARRRLPEHVLQRAVRRVVAEGLEREAEGASGEDGGSVAGVVRLPAGQAEAPVRLAARSGPAAPWLRFPLLVVDREGRARVAWPGLRLVDAGRLVTGGRLEPDAHEAVRRAFRAAANALPAGLPPAMLEGHELDLPPNTELEGASLGLPVALAFLALWTGHDLPEGWAATGEVDDAAGRVWPVDDVPAKARAARDEGLRVLVPPGQGVEGAEEAGTVAVAARRLGIPLDRPLPQEGLRVREIEDRLQAWIRDVEEQDRTEHRLPGIDPWRVVAGRILDAVALLERPGRERSADRELLDEARIAAATALLHAHDLEASGRVLEGVRRGRLDREHRDLLEVLELARAVMRREPWGGDAAAIAERIAAWKEPSESSERREVFAFGLSTRARWLQRVGRAAEAVPLLERARAILREVDPPEAARTGVYLARALRQSGRLDRAAEVLRETRNEDLPSCDAWSRAYARSTDAFLLLEEARLAWIRGDAEATWERVGRGLGLASEARKGWRVEAEFLSLGARACHALGLLDEAEHLVGRLRVLEDYLPEGDEDARWWWRRILDAVFVDNGHEDHVA